MPSKLTRATLWEVNEYCTCGAQLPADARFCHKCGKPQYELTVDQEAEVPVQGPVQAPLEPPVPPAAPPIPEVGWRNPIAVRVGVLAGSVISLVLILPMPPLFGILRHLIVPVAGAFWSVHLYRRRTGISVNTRGGARLGWITGIFCFLIMTVVFTITIIGLATSGALQETLKEAAAASGSLAGGEQIEAILQSPAGIGIVFFAYLVTTFLMTTLLASLGGMLGAKILEKD
jgi:hypothetical protein